jgi:hypothetical protein
MNRHLAVNRPLLLASAVLGAMLALVTWPAGLAANPVLEESAKPVASEAAPTPTDTPAVDSRRAIVAAKRASGPAVDPVARATSHSIMGTLCAGANASAVMFTICDTDDYTATCCDDGTLVETLCKDGPTHGTVCEESPGGFTPTHCPEDEDSDKPVDIPTFCAGGEKLYTECPDQTLHTICQGRASTETACPNAPGGVQPTLCPNGPVHTHCTAGLLHTLCQGGVPSRQTACANAPGGVQPTICAGGVPKPTFCPGGIMPTTCTNGPNQPTVCPNGETYTICIAAEPSPASACPPGSDGSAEPLHR